MIFTAFILYACLRLAHALVDDTTYDEMKYLAHHAFDAYSLLNCTYPEGTTKLATWSTGVKGYLARDDDRKWIIVVFRGSFDIEDFETDDQKTLVPYTVQGSEGCTGNCTVHEGIQTKWAANADTVLGAIRSALAANPDYKIYVTGHSLGGAYTAFAGVTIARTFGVGNVTGYSFAAFRAGNMAYAAYQNESFPGTTYHRVTSLNDDVPAGATGIQLGYWHGGTEYWIMKEPDPAPSDIKICSGAEDPTCNDGQPGANNTGINPAHLVYFVPLLTTNCTLKPE